LVRARNSSDRVSPLSFLSPHSPVESFVGKGSYLKRIRYHGRGQFGVMHKYYAHYYLKLREGPAPPKKKRAKTDHKSFVTRKLILAGPRSIPNSL
jgi:large subunit ribosomal protein L22